MNNTGNSEASADIPSPEFCRFISEVIGGPHCLEGLTLGGLRKKLFGMELVMSGEGELMFPLDRLSLINELDELIDKFGSGKGVVDICNQDASGNQ